MSISTYQEGRAQEGFWSFPNVLDEGNDENNRRDEENGDQNVSIDKPLTENLSITGCLTYI